VDTDWGGTFARRGEAVVISGPQQLLLQGKKSSSSIRKRARFVRHGFNQLRGKSVAGGSRVTAVGRWWNWRLGIGMLLVLLLLGLAWDFRFNRLPAVHA
jgi:hypothetical protein